MVPKGVMLPAASLATEQQFCTSASSPGAAVALDVSAGVHGRCCTHEQLVVTALQRRNCRRNWPGIDYFQKNEFGEGCQAAFGCCH